MPPRPRTPARLRIPAIVGGIALAAVALALPRPSSAEDHASAHEMPMVRVPAAAMTPTLRALRRTDWSVSSAGQSVTIDAREPVTASALRYTPGDTTVERYAIASSRDGKAWNVVADGIWAPGGSAKTAAFSETRARYFRLTAVAGGRPDASAVSLLRARPGLPAAAPAPSRGSWSAVTGFPLVPASMAVLPGDRVLLWAAVEGTSFGGGAPAQTQAAIFDLATGTSSQRTVVDTAHEMFCTGIAMLPGGRILIAGGSSAGATTIYDPATDTWEKGPDLTIPRGYNSSVTLSTGQVLTLGGSWSGGQGGKDGELFTVGGGWKRLSGVTAPSIFTADAWGVYRADNHAWLFAAAGGSVFQAGPSVRMNWITTRGEGSITAAGRREGDGDAMNGTAVMYEPGRILTAGGAPSYRDSNATSNAFVVDITGGPGSTPTVTRTGSMAAARSFHNSVVLPDGTVLVVGGQSRSLPFTDTGAAMTPELWNPATGVFSPMADLAVPRTYHSTALLLRDGRVLSAGGGLCGACATNHPDGQIFTPPYLLNAKGKLRARPSITSSPAVARVGGTLSVTTAKPVASFALVRMSATTHTVNTDQRRIAFAAGTGTTNALKLPAAATATPGKYFLFALDAAGTPSVASIVKIY